MIYEGASICPRCGGRLKYYDKVNRTIIFQGRSTNSIELKRFRCSVCGSVHREIPNYIYPYKQYDGRIVKAVLDGFITSDTLDFEDHPCEMTMARWRSRKIQLLLWKP